jgi:hypothetical protein
LSVAPRECIARYLLSWSQPPTKISTGAWPAEPALEMWNWGPNCIDNCCTLSRQPSAHKISEFLVCTAQPHNHVNSKHSKHEQYFGDNRQMSELKHGLHQSLIKYFGDHRTQLYNENVINQKIYFFSKVESYSSGKCRNSV